VGFDPPRLWSGQTAKVFAKRLGRGYAGIPAVDRVEGLGCPRCGRARPNATAAILASEVVQQAIGLLKPGIRELDVGSRIEYQDEDERRVRTGI